MKSTRTINFNGVTMTVFQSPEIISDEIVLKRNFYEYDLFEKWKDYFPADGLMLDIGANIGNHSLMYNHFFPNLEIWAFEPILENFILLKQNTENIPNILSFNVGVGSRTGVVNFEFDDAYNNSGGCKVSNVIGNQNMIIALDDVEFHDKRISFIKLDVEGHELSCIEGMRELINKHKPLIWVEDYKEAAKEDGNNSIKFLLELGYSQLEFSPDANFLMKW